MTLFKKYIILLIIPLLAFTSHKYYLSHTQIDYKAKEKTLHITMRVFIDDLETVLNKNFNKDFNLDTPKELAKTDNFIGFYLNTHFNLSVNNIPQNITLLGKEYEDDIVNFYLEIDSIPEINNIFIQNTLLMGEFDTQQNIIKLDINNQKKTMILNKSNDKDLLKF